ncbi:MAG: hypothetical protein ABS939_15300 [Psychrobacillus sp.]
MENNVKRWYTDIYPTDELGKEIDDNLTFVKLASDVNNVYQLLGVWDSVVRERVFTRLSELMNEDYDYVYQLWLREC